VHWRAARLCDVHREVASREKRLQAQTPLHSSSCSYSIARTTGHRLDLNARSQDKEQWIFLHCSALSLMLVRKVQYRLAFVSAEFLLKPLKIFSLSVVPAGALLLGYNHNLDLIST
jgi:hypothetical protein